MRISAEGARKVFFSEEMKQKTFFIGARPILPPGPRTQRHLSVHGPTLGEARGSYCIEMSMQLQADLHPSIRESRFVRATVYLPQVFTSGKIFLHCTTQQAGVMRLPSKARAASA
jgi:hypothetical protein